MFRLPAHHRLVIVVVIIMTILIINTCSLFDCFIQNVTLTCAVSSDPLPNVTFSVTTSSGHIDNVKPDHVTVEGDTLVAQLTVSTSTSAPRSTTQYPDVMSFMEFNQLSVYDAKCTTVQDLGDIGIWPHGQQPLVETHYYN